MIPLFTLWDGGTVVPGVLICETGVYNLNGQDATFGLTGNVTTDMEAGEYVLAGQIATFAITGPPVPPPNTGSGGRRGGRGRIGRAGGDFSDQHDFKVLIEEYDRNQKILKYIETKWVAKATWKQIDEAIAVINEELGNLEESSEKSQLLRKALKHIKKKRNQRIILLSIE